MNALSLDEYPSKQEGLVRKSPRARESNARANISSGQVLKAFESFFFFF